MAIDGKGVIIPILIISVLVYLTICESKPSTIPSQEDEPEQKQKQKQQQEPPKPSSWPLQFHSILVMNKTGELQLIDLWYDWPNGRNFNIIRSQLGDDLLYDLEWNNGTSFYYTLLGGGEGGEESCRSVEMGVGILRPDWLDGAEYLGQRIVDGFLCNAWTKVDFIWYYEDVATRRPVHWRFFSGREAHVMMFEVGAVLEDSKWQAPHYCFGSKKDGDDAMYMKPHASMPPPLITDMRGLAAL